MIKITICDANSADASDLSVRLKAIAKKEKINISINTYENAKTLLFDWEEANKYSDILYMDTHILGISGIEVSETLRKMGYNNEIIFNTNSEPEVFNAFDVDAFHYILKGRTSNSKFEEIFLNAVNAVKSKEQEYMTVSSVGESKSIAVRDIKYFTVKDRIITVHYRENQTFDFYARLNKLLLQVEVKGFTQVARNVIINLEQIESYSNVSITMRDGMSFPIGRIYKNSVNKLITEFFDGE
jgi:DNA-binding LytR/AlgR family response regulator